MKNKIKIWSSVVVGKRPSVVGTPPEMCGGRWHNFFPKLEIECDRISGELFNFGGRGGK